MSIFPIDPIVSELVGEGVIARRHAAEALGVGQSTLDRWTAEGRLGMPVRLGGRRVYFRLADLRRLLITSAAQS